MLLRKPMKPLFLLFFLFVTFIAIADRKITGIPIANAGTDQTIYLSQTSTVTLDGSASSGDSYHWTDVSTDYKSGATITSPNSLVTTVTGLKQGVWYFQLTVTSAGSTAMDIVVIKVDYDVPPANATLIHHFDFVDNAAVINKRDDTTSFFPVSNYQYSQTNGDSNGDDWFYFRDRTNGLYIDPERGKLVSTIQDGYQGDAGYARSEVALADYSFTMDTLHTYVFEWKGYYPQDNNYLIVPGLLSWHTMLNIFQIHSYAQTATVYSYGLTGADSIHVSDTHDDGTGKLQTYQKSISSRHNFYDKAHTIRVTVREGRGYPGQTAFIKSEIDGVTNYYRDTGQVGSSYFDDYVKFAGLYDYNHFVVNVDSASRGRKFSLVTEAFNVYLLNNNQPPSVNAGPNQTISLPNNKVTLSGSAKDPDGTISSYQWTKLSGPSNGIIINNANSASTTVTGLLEGVYQFQLKVIDNKGLSATSTIQVTVNPPTNYAPVANAGPDQTITLPTASLNLSGSANDSDGTVVSYLWTKISGPTAIIVDTSSLSTSVNGLTQGTYLFQLAVKDDKGAVGKDTVKVTVNAAKGTITNQAPVARAGSDQTITLPTDSLYLSGSGYDNDGTVVSYSWTKVSGPAATIVDPSSSSTVVAGLVQGIYKFELIVTDDKGAVGKDTINILVNAETTTNVNKAPIANAGNDQSIALPNNNTKLTGNGSDSDGSIVSYLWRQISGPSQASLKNPSSSFTPLKGLVQGVYAFELTVTDNEGAIGKDTVKIFVNTSKENSITNSAPSVNAGSDQTITLPVNSVQLSGSGSDSDGTIVSYSWTKISGPAVTISNSSSAATTIKNLTQGIYKFELTVTDDKGAKDSDTVKVTVNAAQTTAPNQAPVANAGSDKTITLPVNSVQLSGSGSDSDGTIVSYSWTKISGPAVTISNSSSAATTIKNLTQGIYEFELTVTDDKGAKDSDTVKVTVNAAQTTAPNQAPVANAGSDKTITLPVNSVQLSGSGSDSDGTIVSYSWTKISGPAVTISNSSSAATTIKNLTQGIYEFELTVTDDKGAKDSDTVKVTVNAAQTTAPNQAPVANAGSDKTITLPVNSVQLSGSGSDSDGTIVSYSWTKISGPAVTISNSSSAATTIKNLTQGIYEFELTVTDDKGAKDSDTVKVTVNAAQTTAPNQAPVANAGSDKTITLPVNSVQLSGSGSDSDGTIVSYSWTKISGPAVTISNSSSAATTIKNLTQGIYEFELTVTDDKGAKDSDTVKVTVNAAQTTAPNQAPVANAGSDKTITLPVNSVQLSGSGSDSDGTIVSYSWTKISGPAVTISNSSSAATTIKNLTQGIYEFELTVTDDKGAKDSDTVKVTVNAAQTTAPNQAPVANAGSDKTITLPVNSVQLTGSGSDEDGNISSYSWTKISGPTNFSIVNSSSPIVTINALVEGVYKFELIVTDDKGAIAKDTVKVIVNAAQTTVSNTAPIVDAGPDKTITLPTNNIQLAATASDKDGSISSYSWTKILGPSSYTIVNPQAATTNVSDLQEGVYQFQIKVTDDKGSYSTDTIQVMVIVSNAPATQSVNTPPVANAGNDLTIVSSTSSVTLTGSGTDKEGQITAYNWQQLSGPSVSEIVEPSSPTTAINNLTGGTYEFQLTVTDNSGATSKDTVKVTVALERLAPESQKLNVYPNPVHDITNLKVYAPEVNTNVSIIITDMSGTTVFKKEFVSGSIQVTEQINMSNLVKGVYVVSVVFNGMERQSVKIVKL